MNIQWKEHTWYSKLAAVVFFLLVLPALAFYIGVEYEKTREINTLTESQTHMENPKITKEAAIQIATKSNGGFLGTWVEAVLDNGKWHVSARSKSVNPPVLFVIDADSGNIVYKNLNTDANPVPKDF